MKYKNYNPNIKIRYIKGIPQIREIDRRNETKDSFHGHGMVTKSKKNYCYGQRVLVTEGTEIVECFPTQTENRIVLVNGFEKAIQNSSLQELPRWALFDPRTREQLYEIDIDENGNKVIVVKNECRIRQILASQNSVPDRVFDCLTDSKGNIYQTERRNLKPRKKQIRKRLSVENSCNAREMDTLCCNARERRTTAYQQRQAHHKRKTKYACGKRPEGWRYW